MIIRVPIETQELEDYKEWCLKAQPIVYKGKDYFVVRITCKSNSALAEVEL